MVHQNSLLTRSLIVGVVTCCIAFPASAQEDDRSTARPSKSIAEMLQRFVDECETISPGSGKFPATFFIGETRPTKNEVARQQVTLQSPFRMSRFEMTQELYEAISGKNPSRWQGLRNSVERLTFAEARKFCESLTSELQQRKLIDADEAVRLPTSIEWEYCCRAGTTTRYSIGDKVGEGTSTELLNEVAWHTGNAAGNDPAVGVLKANAWNLHDMHGYLWEFVDDSSLAEGNSTADGTVVVRGGSWRDPHPLLSCAAYLTIPSSQSGDHIGFRCVIAKKPGVKNGPKR